MSSTAIFLLLCLSLTSSRNLVLPRSGALESDMRNLDDETIESGSFQRESSMILKRNFHVEDEHKDVADAKSKKKSINQINEAMVSETLVNEVQGDKSTRLGQNEVVVFETLADQKVPVNKVKSVHIEAVSLEPLIDKGGVVKKVLSAKEAWTEKLEPVKEMGPEPQRRKDNKKLSSLNPLVVDDVISYSLEDTSTIDETKTAVEKAAVSTGGPVEEVVPISLKRSADNVKSNFIAPLRKIGPVSKAALSHEVDTGYSESLVNNETTLGPNNKDESIRERNNIEQVFNVAIPSKRKNYKSVEKRTVKLVKKVVNVESASELVNEVKQEDIFIPTGRKNNNDVSDFEAPVSEISPVYKAALTNEVDTGSSESLLNNETPLGPNNKDESIRERNKIEQVVNVAVPSKRKNITNINYKSVEKRTVELVNKVVNVESASELENKVKQDDIFIPRRRKHNKDVTDFKAPVSKISPVYKATLSNEVDTDSSESIDNKETTLESNKNDKSVEKRAAELVYKVVKVESASELVNKVKQDDIFIPTRRKNNKDVSSIKTSSVTNDLFQYANNLMMKIKKDFDLIAHHESYNGIWNKYIYSLVGHFLLQCTINLAADLNANLTTWYDDAFDLALRKVKRRRSSTATQLAAPLRRAIDIFKRVIAVPIEIIQTNCAAKMKPRDCMVVFFEKLIEASKGCPNFWNHYIIFEKAVKIQQLNLKSVDPSKNQFILKSTGFTLNNEVFDNILEDLNGKRKILRKSLVGYTELYKLVQHYQDFGLLGCVSSDSP